MRTRVTGPMLVAMVDAMMDGKEIRTPQTHPYSYDPFVIYNDQGEANGTVYSDRLYQWDAVKHNDLCQKHFGNKGQYWDERDPEKIEALLRDFLEKDNLKLIRITQHCNHANGYPCWQFDVSC